MGLTTCVCREHYYFYFFKNKTGRPKNYMQCIAHTVLYNPRNNRNEQIYCLAFHCPVERRQCWHLQCLQHHMQWKLPR
jgi:hypothetical protein